MDKIKARVAREIKSLDHPRDRRVRQIEKKEKRSRKAVLLKAKQQSEHQRRLDRYSWFRDTVDLLGVSNTEVGHLSAEDAALLLQVYIDRLAREASQIRQQRNPPKGLLKQLHNAWEAEMAEFRSTEGVLIPQVCTAKGVRLLLEWDGTTEGAKSLESLSVSLGTRTLPSEKVEAVASLVVEAAGIEETTTTATQKRLKKRAKLSAGGKKLKVKRSVTKKFRSKKP